MKVGPPLLAVFGSCGDGGDGDSGGGGSGGGGGGGDGGVVLHSDNKNISMKRFNEKKTYHEAVRVDAPPPAAHSIPLHLFTFIFTCVGHTWCCSCPTCLMLLACPKWC